jgi:hypothetical protein
MFWLTHDRVRPRHLANRDAQLFIPPLRLMTCPGLDSFSRMRSLIVINGALNYEREGQESPVDDVSATEKKLATETLLYSLCLRVAKSDIGNWFDTSQSMPSRDAATGTPPTGIIPSLQARR